MQTAVAKPLGLRPDASVVILTGAGISAESGIPTFRDPGGIWQRYDVNEVATPQGFMADPLKVWRFYSERRRQGLECSPNAGHLAITALERRQSQHGRFSLITQNVDELHRRAGTRNVMEVHGSLYRTKCRDPDCTVGREPFRDEASYDEAVPRCPHCGAMLRPAVVWFNEYLDPDLEHRARVAVSECDVFIAIGTSGAVWPVAGYVGIASGRGARTVIVNLEAPDNSAAFGECYLGKAAEALPVLFEVP